MKEELEAKVYFADTYASWQRGTNEIQFIEDRLNNRPWKCRGFKTPNRVFSDHKRRVALRS